MRYDMTQLSTELGLPYRYFLTREKGEAAYERLADLLNSLPEDEPLVLVFPAEQLMDASFADEAVVRLYEAIADGKFGERTLLLNGLTEDSRHNIDAVIHLRNLKLALLAVDDSGTWQIIGQLERSLRETLDIVAEVGEITAPQLSEQIESAVNTASNRLKRLYDSRLIRRQVIKNEKGLHYTYHFWQWDA